MDLILVLIVVLVLLGGGGYYGRGAGWGAGQYGGLGFVLLVILVVWLLLRGGL